MSSTSCTEAVSPHLTDTYRCARCGVVSPERTCFIIPERHGRPPHYVRCVTCEERRLAPTTSRSIAAAVFVLFWPMLLFVLSLHEPHAEKTAALGLLVAVLAYPTGVIAHETGHALAAWALGLEIAAVRIGHGPVVWRFRFRTIPVQIHAWPLSGGVFVGSGTRTWLRTRAWITVAAGPLVNAIFVGVTAHFWLRLDVALGTAVPGVWLAVNLALLVLSLFPQRTRQLGQEYRSDGLALLSIPRMTDSDLTVYLHAAPLIRAFHYWQADEFTKAKAAAEDAMARAPTDLTTRLMLTSSLIGLGEYAAAATCVLPALEVVAEKEPVLRAATWNAASVALLLASARDPKGHAELLEAERLSAEAFQLYPCILEYRSTRALALVATDRPAEALELLEYLHYDTATDRQRGHRELTRAFAFQRLCRPAETERSAQAAVKLDARNVPLLRILGVAIE